MLRIVVVTGSEGLQAAGQAVDRGVEDPIVFIGKYNVEISIQLGSGKVVEVLGNDREADQVVLLALRQNVSEVYGRTELQ